MKLATSDTFEGIRSCIKKFYAGEDKPLRPLNATTWEVLRLDGVTVIPSVWVRLAITGRYIFEKRPEG